MKNIIKLISNNFNLIKPKKYEKNIFTEFSQRKLTIEAANTETIELPEKCTAFLATKFDWQDIQKFIGPCRKRLWLTLAYQIKKGDVIGYLLLEADNFNVHYVAKEKTSSRRQKKTKCPNNYLPKDWSKRWKNYFERKNRSQTGGFLNRYDFAYAGRDTVNQVGKVAPKIISQTTGEINKIAQQRIDQIIRSEGAEIERVAPKIISWAIEEVYKTPFRMLGSFGKTQFHNIKRKLFK